MTGPVSEFEEELRAFDHAQSPLDASVFYGSSSFRLWDNLAASFPGFTVVNRGFGGSTLAECVDLLPRLVFPLRPTTLVLYAADNDLDQGTTPDQILALFRQFIERLRAQFPQIPVAFISVKPSPARFWNLTNIRRANEQVQSAANDYPGVAYLDMYPSMLSPAGGSRPELFTDDGLHMNSAGYDLWTARIRLWLESLHQAT